MNNNVKMIETKVDEALEARFNKIKLGANVFSKEYKYYNSKAQSDIEGIITDIYTIASYGLLDSEEVKNLIENINWKLSVYRTAYHSKYEEAIGEDEYCIQWLMYSNNFSREKAIEFQKEYGI